MSGTLYRQAIPYGRCEAVFETGEIARQADGSALVTMDGTVVMGNVTFRRDALPNASFLPLTVDYQERSYAAGRFPGGFFRREGRPSEKEILTSRLIDRFLRPLFPDFFYHEVQVVLTVLSYNPEMDSEVPAMLAAGAAVALSGVPFNGPATGAKVGRVDGELILNPTTGEMKKSDLDLSIAGTAAGVLMVESSANELPEDEMLKAVMLGHENIQKAVAAIGQLAEKAGREKWDWQQPELESGKKEKIAELAAQSFPEAYNIADKQARTEKLSEAKRAIREEVVTADSPPVEENLINSELKKEEAKILRGRILAGETRIDGRGTRDIRPINIRLGVLPRVHGNALFTRGETQALVSLTLGNNRDEQKIDALGGEYFEPFLLHYNFPPYSTGETGRMLGPKRREIGHGRLAKRALLAVMPDLAEYGYPVRIVSEITESNGSSSMASVCGGSLAMMDAGVPLSRHVAGVAMGLIKEDDRFAVLSDILGDEDHLGDMDFKVAGTEKGITALQMDLKIDSIDAQIMQAALEQALEGRLHILGKMNEAISEPRKEMSPYAPRIVKMKISVDKIRDVIGKGGSVIKSITESTETNIDVADDGVITISGRNLEVCEKAKEKIEAITAELQAGMIYEGRVEKILENVGAVISILPGRDGLLHISQISRERVNRVEDYLQQGQTVRVKVIQSDPQGRVRFSMKNLEEE